MTPFKNSYSFWSNFELLKSNSNVQQTHLRLFKYWNPDLDKN